MSQRAPRRLPRTSTLASGQMVDGATAKAVRPEPVAASEVPFVDSKKRTTLSLVPSSNEKLRRPLFVMVSVLVLLAFAVIVSLVLLNTSVAQRQYEMVSLRNQERELSQENQALLKEAQSLAAPQTLAKRAKELGLVAPAAPGLVDLESGSISLEAEPASKSEETATSYGTLPLPGDSIRSRASDDAESAKVAEANQKKAEAEEKPGNQAEQSAATAAQQAAGDGQAEATKPETAKPEESKPVTREQGADGRPVFEAGELNGGTIPAPSVKSPSN